MMFIVLLAVVLGAVGFAVMSWRLSRFPGRLQFPKISRLTGRIPTLWGLRNRFSKARKVSRDCDDHDFEAEPLLLDERDF